MNGRLIAAALALLIGALAAGGCGGDDDGGGGSGSGTAAQTTTTTDTGPAATTEEGGGAAGGGEEIQVAADPGGALKFDKTELTAPAGTVTIVMANPSSLPHAVGIKGNGVDESGETVDQGGTSTVSADLAAGEYEFYCPVGGHEQAGMKGTLTVE